MEASYDLATTLDCLSAADPTAEQLDHGWQAVERSDLEGAETIEDWLVACSSLRPTSSDPQSPKNLLLERLLAQAGFIMRGGRRGLVRAPFDRIFSLLVLPSRRTASRQTLSAYDPRERRLK